VILSGDTRQHGPVEASDALVAIERHAGVKPVELRRIRRQDPNLGKTQQEAKAIAQYRSAVEAAAKGDLRKSFEQLDAMGAVVPCSAGDQADRLAADYLALTASGAPAVVVSQTWSEVHRLNERVRDALRSKGLLGTSDIMVQALDRLDLTTAQKRDQRFYPPEAVVVFNRTVRQTEAGKTGKLAAVLPDAVLVETEGRLVRVANRMLDHITVSLPRDIPLSSGDRLCLKANRTLPSGAKVTNGELATVKSVKACSRCIPPARSACRRGPEAIGASFVGNSDASDGGSLGLPARWESPRARRSRISWPPSVDPRPGWFPD
jgi:hypothetical protein